MLVPLLFRHNTVIFVHMLEKIFTQLVLTPFLRHPHSNQVPQHSTDRYHFMLARMPTLNRLFQSVHKVPDHKYDV